ncbi:MAG: hypothetical protein K0R57_2249 [Paenibacillaceae bacterium]|jgi:uncharacterized protein YqkB|nr:hypothetical protein [Paenibacillaceae bacterium]
MEIRMNGYTTDQLEKIIGKRGGSLKLFYDTEDCGCNGVLVLQILDQPYPTDVLVQTEPFQVFVDRQQESLFDERLSIEADPEFPVFKIGSDGSLYTSNARLQDLRKQSV